MKNFPKKFPNFLNLKKQGLNPEPCANQNGEIPGGAVRTGIRAALDSARWKGCPVGPWVSSALLPRGSRSLSLSLPRDKASFVCICSSSSNRAARSDNRRFAVSKISSDRGTAFFSTSRFIIWCFVEEVSTNSMLKLSSLDARHFFFGPPPTPPSFVSTIWRLELRQNGHKSSKTVKEKWRITEGEIQE